MWRILSNIVEIFVYATVYMIIVLISMKIVGATISSDFERKITEEGNTGTSATDVLVMQSGTNWYLAVFNYTSAATNKTVDFTRAAIPSAKPMAPVMQNM